MPENTLQLGQQGDLFAADLEQNQGISDPVSSSRRDSQLSPEERTPPNELVPYLELKCDLYLSDKKVAQRYGTHRSTIWRWVRKKKHFPEPIKLGSGVTRWHLKSLLDFEALRAAPVKHYQKGLSHGQRNLGTKK